MCHKEDGGVWRARVVVVIGMCSKRDGGADTREIHEHEPAKGNSVGTRLLSAGV